MTGRWYIDNKDIYKAYNVGVVNGGFSDLLLFPALVTPYSNDWPEHNGIDADLSNPLLQNKNVNISFASVTKDNVLVDNFLSFITTPGYKDLDIRSMGKIFKLRPSSENNRSVSINAQTFTIQFIDDYPRSLLSSVATRQGYGMRGLPRSMYSLDGVRFDEYGIIVELGKAEIFKMPALKQNLERKISNLDSVIYDADFVRFQSKDVTLKCALYCDTIERFWQNYYSFFAALVKPDARQLTVEYAEDTYSCFYKNMANPIFYKGSGYALLKFDLTLTFTDYEPTNTIYVWGSQDNKVIITEDGINVIKYEI